MSSITLASIIVMITIITLTQPAPTNAMELNSIEKIVNIVSPSASDATIRRYPVRWEDVDDVIFYMGLFVIVFGIIFYFFLCFGCGHLTCGVSLIRNRQQTHRKYNSMDLEMNVAKIDYDLHRYPFCLVWTPIPLITWLLPFVGHMGIATSQGIIRDFAGPYFVSEDEMGFAWPTRYLQLDVNKVEGGSTTWDDAVQKASTEYTKRMHNLFWDNCHSHCGMALSLMRYGGSTWWGMVKLAAWMFLFGKYVRFWGFVKTWLPFVIIVTSAVCLWKFL